MTIKKIGATNTPTTMDYSTLAAWIAACPANLVTAVDTWEGECYDQGEFTAATTPLTIAGITTDATHNVQLRCATGASFRDKAGVRSNALDYNGTTGAGVAITCSGVYISDIITSSVAFTTITGVQVKSIATGGARTGISCTAGGNNTITNCLSRAPEPFYLPVATAKLYNCLGIGTVSGQSCFTANSASSEMIGCTAVFPGSGNTVAAFSTYPYGTALIKDCAGFGFSAFQVGAGGATAGSGSNCTDNATAFGTTTANQVSKTFANQFVSTTTDFRVKAGADLISNGTYDALADPDISKFTRNGTTPTIGAWEYASAAVADQPQPDIWDAPDDDDDTSWYVTPPQIADAIPAAAQPQEDPLLQVWDSQEDDDIDWWVGDVQATAPILAQGPPPAWDWDEDAFDESWCDDSEPVDSGDMPIADNWDWQENAVDEWYTEDILSANLPAAPMFPEPWDWDEVGDDDWIVENPPGADVALVPNSPPVQEWDWDEETSPDDVPIDDSEPVDSGDAPANIEWQWEDQADDDWPLDAALGPDVLPPSNQSPDDAWNWDEDASEDAFDTDSETVDSGELAVDDPWNWDDDAPDDQGWPLEQSTGPDLLSGTAPTSDEWDWAEDVADDIWCDDSEPVDQGDMPAPIEWADDEDADDWWTSLDAPQSADLPIIDNPPQTDWPWDDDEAEETAQLDAITGADVIAPPDMAPGDSWAWDEDFEADEWWHNAYFMPQTTYASAPQGGRSESVRIETNHRPPVISGHRPGNINTGRPGNGGGSRR